MYDYIDCRVTIPAEHLTATSGLILCRKTVVDRNTGEETTLRGTVGNSRALDFTYNAAVEELRFKGSLHKFYTGGSNAGHFTRSDTIQAIKRLTLDLGLSSETVSVRALEFGVNVVPPCETADLLNRLHLWHSSGTLHPFRPMHGLRSDQGKNTQTTSNSKFWLKTYDKGGQERLRAPVLRLEYHTQATDLCRRLKKPQLSLSDLKQLEVWNSCAEILKSALQGIIFHEPVDLKRMPASEAQFYQTAGRAEYWQGVQGSKKRRHRDKYRALGQQYRTDTFTYDLIRAAVQQIERLGHRWDDSARSSDTTSNPPIMTFAEIIGKPYLSSCRKLTGDEKLRVTAGHCAICGRSLPIERRSNVQTCPRSIRQCRNLKSNRYHNPLKLLRKDYNLSLAGQGRFFDFMEGVKFPDSFPGR